MLASFSSGNELISLTSLKFKLDYGMISQAMNSSAMPYAQYYLRQSCHLTFGESFSQYHIRKEYKWETI